MQNQEFKFKAFISYSHKDSRKARGLHRRLEAYRIPKAVRKEIAFELPKKLKPVYLDSFESESGGQLSEVMRQNLKNSNALIVVCSPNSAKSEYVGYEIETFKSEYKDRKIIPYIVEGEPSSKDPQIKCYPPSLDEGITGSSIKELGRHKALVKVVAAICNINFDLLWDRHKRRRRKQMLFGFSTAVVIVGLFFSSLMYARYMRYLKDATANYVEATMLLDKGETNKGVAFLTKSLEKIAYKPSVEKLNDILINKSYLILDTVTNRKQHDYTLTDYRWYDNTKSFFSPSGKYNFSLNQGKLNICKSDDSSKIGSVDLYYQGNIVPLCGFTSDEQIMFVAEPIYDETDVYQDDLKTILEGSKEFRIRIYNVSPLSMIKDIRKKGALNEVSISPMGNHIVFTYQVEKEYEKTIEAVPLSQPYKKWKCNELDIPNQIMFNPNGIYVSAVFTKGVNTPDNIRIYNIFNKDDYESCTIEVGDKVQCYCYSKDGRRMAILNKNKELCVYNVPQGDLIFAPLMLADSLDVVSLNFNNLDSKININTRERSITYLLQKSPIDLSKIKFTQDVTENLSCNSSRGIIATLHPVGIDKGYISFASEKECPVLKFNEKVNTMTFSERGNYLAIGTGDPLNDRGTGNFYLYRLIQNKDSILFSEIYHSQLAYPVFKIAFNQQEDCIIAHTVLFNEKANEVCSFLIDAKQKVINKKILCDGKVEVAKFINKNVLAVGTDKHEIELWNTLTDKKELALKTTHFPIDIETDNKQNILVASTFNHSVGEVRYFDKYGNLQWTTPLTTKYGIQKIIVADNRAIIVSEQGLISIIDLKTNERIVNDIKVNGTIKDVILVKNNLTVLFYITNSDHDFSLKGSEQFSVNQGNQSIIQTFDIETGKELGLPLVKNYEIIGLELYEDNLLYYTTKYFYSERFGTTKLNIDVRDLTNTANDIAGCHLNSYGVVETEAASFVDMNIDNKLNQWFSSSFELRTILPGNSNLVRDQIDLMCEFGDNEVLQALDIYPSYLKTQNEFWFSEAVRIAKENFVLEKDARSINDHNTIALEWESYYSNYKSDAIYSDPEAKLFADFYTKLIVRQHPNDISALKERAGFCQHTNNIDEFNHTMDQIEETILNQL